MRIAERLYYLGLSARKYYGIKNQKRLPFRVLSVGNLTLGGTGKTPATMAIAEEAQRRGFRPVILTRGYRGREKGPCFVTKGEGLLLDVNGSGDEPALMGQKLRGIPIVKGGNRYIAGMFSIKAIRSQQAENTPSFIPDSEILFILDDGFQHWTLFRDKDIVLIDADNPFSNRKLIPFGRLREPVNALSRADVIVITETTGSIRNEDDLRRDLIKEIKHYNSQAPLYFAHHALVGCTTVTGEKIPVDVLNGKKVFGFCALANPASFRKTIESTGAVLTGFRHYRDHFRYRSDDVRDITDEAGRSGADSIVTTEKDIIKMRAFDLPKNMVILEIAFSVNADFYTHIFSF
jgi:tetraacyldisaccharide 4'-kinase